MVSVKPERLDRHQAVGALHRVERARSRKEVPQLQRVRLRLKGALFQRLRDEDHLLLPIAPNLPDGGPLKRIRQRLPVPILHPHWRVVERDVVAHLVAELRLQFVTRHQMAESYPFNLLPGAARAVAEVGPIHMLKFHLLALQRLIAVAAHLIGLVGECRVVSHPSHAATAELLVLDS